MNRSSKVVAIQAASLAGAFMLMFAAAVETRAATPSTATVVHIGNFAFAQQVMKVRTGTTVTWVNDDDIPHNVVATSHAFRSKVLDTDDRFSFTFTKPGQFNYLCALHPHMTGKIVVGA